VSRSFRSELTRYADFRPTPHDTAGMNLPDRQDWYVAPCGHTRDSGVLEESNFACAATRLEASGATEDVEVHRFGHWGPGWFEIIIVRPDSPAYVEACEIADELESYPVLDEDDLSEREGEEADRVWRDCYNARERADYIAKHRSQFEFRSFADMLGCVRGNYFAGYASELLS
jgi:hypothetical protein